MHFEFLEHSHDFLFSGLDVPSLADQPSPAVRNHG